jgi:glycogen(starch) synthase
MKVFMLGWEFPPYISGGLGTACYGLTRGLDQAGVEVAFVLPMALPHDATSHVSFRTPATLSEPPREGVRKRSRRRKGEKWAAAFEHVTMHVVPAMLQAYGTPASYEEAIQTLRRQLQLASDAEAAKLLGMPGGMPVAEAAGERGGRYTGDLMSQVRRYATLAVELAKDETFDVVHAHDWMTYPAGLAVAAYSGKPLVVHVHSTEFDRSGENVNQQVYDIERAGMHGADRVVCVSYLTRGIVLSRYGVPAEKVEVVYNAVEPPSGRELQMAPISRDEKIVLFLGRITMQKGPEYFLLAAKKVLEKYKKKVRFVIAGSGDLVGKTIELAADLGIGRSVTFTGFLRGDDVARVFQMADLYVMPSVSEPFGIAPLEALAHNVPVIISKQSGVSEVLTHVLKVDFWDTDEMANKILAILRHPPLQRVLRQQGHIELQKLSWRDSAEQCKQIYQDLVRAGA